MNYSEFINKMTQMKKSGKGLMSEQQYASIGYLVKLFEPCNLLVFGLGHDSLLWKDLNKGRTVFIEDDKEWIDQFKNFNLDIRHVQYTTEAKDHEKIQFNNKLLEIEFDKDIEKEVWDIIIVDAPLGHGPPGREYKGPGRMQSIYNAHRLLKPGGICVVDDMKRLIEQKYSLNYFGESNIMNVVEDKVCFFKKEEEQSQVKDLKSYLKGKNVALVGPAAYMMGSGLGKEIDSHDVVVRINRGLDSISEFKNDIGSRTDILYSCLIERAQQAGEVSVEKFKNFGVKHIIAPPASGMDGICSNFSFHQLVDLKKIKEINKSIPVSLISKELNNKIAKLVDCKPNTGFLSIYDLLENDIKSLSIYGFSFYLDGFIKGQKSGVEKEKNCSEQDFADMAFNSKRHVQKNIWKYAKETLIKNEKVFLDEKLLKILKLESLDRNLFKEKEK